VLTVLAMAVTSAQGAPTEEEIAKAVRQLGDNNFAVRETFFRTAARSGDHSRAGAVVR
jgi:hypothetical protein